MPYYVDFSWKTDSHPMPAAQIEEWESIMRPALGGAGWVVMRQVNGTWRVEEAQLTGAGLDGEAGARADRTNAVTEALRRHGKTVS